jgi:hypothetical protein
VKRIVALFSFAFATAAAVAAIVGPPVAAQVAFVQKEVGAPYVKDASPYLAYVQLGQAAAEKLVQGVDYSGRIYIDPAKFPNNSVLTWSLPFRPSASGAPWGYVHLTRGRPSGGVPKLVDPVRRLSEVRELTLSLDAVMSPVGDASVLSDTFLYKDVTLSQAVLELGVFPYTGPAARAFILKSEPIRTGAYKDSQGRVWIARRVGTYCMFMLDSGDALKGDIDLKGFFDFLMGAGLATGDMVYPGTALGVEPAYGAGMLRLNSFAVSDR